MFECVSLHRGGSVKRQLYLECQATLVRPAFMAHGETYGPIDDKADDEQDNREENHAPSSHPAHH